MKKSWIKNIVFRISAICLGFVIALTLGEIITRLFDLAGPLPKQYANYVSDPALLYKPKPLSAYSGSTAEFDYEYRHNSLGFRDEEHDFKKKDNQTYRILGLGDSFTYGVGAKYEETYLYQLEKMLNQRPGKHPKIEIIKAGIPRYFPEAERILLENYGELFAPDLILIGFLPNDVIDTYSGMDAIVVDSSGYLMTREAEKLGPIVKGLYMHSGFCRFLLKRYFDYRITQKRSPHEDDIYKATGYHEPDWVKLQQEYEIMIAIADRLNAGIVLVHIPQKYPWSVEKFYPAQRLSEWSEQHHVGFIGILPAMMAASKNADLYYENDGHCRPAGYSVIAQEIYSYFDRQKLIP